MKEIPRKIVLYDGDCGFCNRSVQLILKYEKDQSICFSALQSDFTAKYFKERNLEKPNLDSFVFIEDDKIYIKSEAALRVVKYLKFPINFLRVFSLIPQWLSDQVYDLVAKYRLKLANPCCAVPLPEQRERFVN